MAGRNEMVSCMIVTFLCLGYATATTTLDSSWEKRQKGVMDSKPLTWDRDGAWGKRSNAEASMQLARKMENKMDTDSKTWTVSDQMDNKMHWSKDKGWVKRSEDATWDLARKMEDKMDWNRNEGWADSNKEAPRHPGTNIDNTMDTMMSDHLDNMMWDKVDGWVRTNKAEAPMHLDMKMDKKMHWGKNEEWGDGNKDVLWHHGTKMDNTMAMMMPNHLDNSMWDKDDGWVRTKKMHWGKNEEWGDGNKDVLWHHGTKMDNKMHTMTPHQRANMKWDKDDGWVRTNKMDWSKNEWMEARGVGEGLSRRRAPIERAVAFWKNAKWWSNMMDR